MVEDRPIISVKCYLPVPVFYFWRKLTHPAARSLCDSWATCFFLFSVVSSARNKYRYCSLLFCVICCIYEHRVYVKDHDHLGTSLTDTWRATKNFWAQERSGTSYCQLEGTDILSAAFPLFVSWGAHLAVTGAIIRRHIRPVARLGARARHRAVKIINQVRIDQRRWRRKRRRSKGAAAAGPERPRTDTVHVKCTTSWRRCGPCVVTSWWLCRQRDDKLWSAVWRAREISLAVPRRAAAVEIRLSYSRSVSDKCLTPIPVKRMDLFAWCVRT